MTVYMLGYLTGTLFGEVLLLGWWAMQQTTIVTPADYWRTRWATAVFSGTFALIGCMLWAEGSIVQYIGHGVTLTTGFSVASGALITFFAHGLVWAVGRVWGVKPPNGDLTKGD